MESICFDSLNSPAHSISNVTDVSAEASLIKELIHGEAAAKERGTMSFSELKEALHTQVSSRLE
jgi:predicted methyltransferase MtxX (methanogen marker protein 4)